MLCCMLRKRTSNTNMALPRGTNLSITLSCCTGLPNLSFTGQRISRRDAEEQVQIAKDLLQMKYRAASDSPHFSSAIRRDIEAAENRLRQAQAVLRDNADFDHEVVPNPFAVLCVEGDDDYRRGMLETKVIRNTRNPLWREKLVDFPLERYLTGRRSMNIDDSDYEPQNLVFYIYHDDAVPDRHDVPCRSDRTWKRDNPQRSICIGKATWNLRGICRHVGGPVFKKDIPVFHPDTNRKIRGAVLEIEAELWAPHVY